MCSSKEHVSSNIIHDNLAILCIYITNIYEKDYKL